MTAAGALAVVGTGVAVATSSDDPKEREEAVLADAAKRLDVAPSELRDALSAAENAQLDADVKAGRLTQEQADAIKERRERFGSVLGGGLMHGKPHLSLRPGGPGGGPIELIETTAKALGISRDELVERMRDGDSLEEIAKAEGKSVDDVREAVESELKERLDKAVADGDLTREQADEMLSRMSDMVEDLGEFRLPGRPPHLPGPLGP
jgi:hypothetical protein